jgi:hypothetical protein
MAREKNTVRIASLSAEEVQDIRVELLAKVRKLFDELFAVRNAEHLAEEGQVHVYRALTALVRVQSSILSDASLDEIQALLEDADAEISQAQPTAASSGTEGGGKKV